MENGKRKRRAAPGRRKKRLMKKYFTVLVTILAVFAAVTAAIAMKYTYDDKKKQAMASPSEADGLATEPTEAEPELPPEEYKLNFAVFGTDKEGIRTDVIFVLSFDTDTKQMALVAVPRDTKVKMTDWMLSDMKERGREAYIPYYGNEKGVCKINEVHAYAGEGHRNEYSVMMLEDLLDIEIDCYINVDLEGFRYIVDAFGGVDMEVAERLYYEDPYQDLYIDLYPGYQHLDGDKAEQLVRYRDGYAEKDLKRIRVQQDFLKALFGKIVNTNNILNNLPSIVYTIFKYVDTDMGLTDAVKYVKYVKELSMDNVYMTTIPGTGGAYFNHDEEGTRELVQRVFYSKDIFPREEGEAAGEESGGETGEAAAKDFRIEVANGGTVAGLATKKRAVLEGAGYNVAFVSTFTGEKTGSTRIVAGTDEILEKAKGLGQYFPNAEFTVNPGLLSAGTDVRVILGTNET